MQGTFFRLMTGMLEKNLKAGTMLSGLPQWLVGKESTCSAGAGVRALDQEGPWRRAWPATPVFLPGQSLGQRSLEGYSLWGHIESGMTELTKHTHVCF